MVRIGMDLGIRLRPILFFAYITDSMYRALGGFICIVYFLARDVGGILMSTHTIFQLVGLDIIEKRYRTLKGLN